MIFRWLKNLIPALRPVSYISWYRDVRPWMNDVQYLRRMDNPDHGWYYTKHIELAHRFDSYEEALLITPGYDGSGGMEERAGVLAV